MPRFRKGKKALRTMDRINEGLYPLFVSRRISPKQENLAKRYMRFHNRNLDAMIRKVYGGDDGEGSPHFDPITVIYNGKRVMGNRKSFLEHNRDAYSLFPRHN